MCKSFFCCSTNLSNSSSFHPLSPFHFLFSVFSFHFSVFRFSLVYLNPQSAAVSSYLPSVERSALPYDSSVRGPRKFAICGESGGCCRSNDGVILCDLHTERDVQFVCIVVIKMGFIYQLILCVIPATFT